MYKNKFKKISNYFNIDKFKSMFFKYFFVFILLIIVPAIILGTVAYKGFYENLNKEIGKANANTLNKTLKSIDIVLNNVEKLTDIYASDPYMVKYFVNPNSTPIDHIGNILNQISTISNSDYVHSVYLYNSFNNMIISSKDGVRTMETFYDQEWLQNFENQRTTMAWMNTRKIKDYEKNEYNCITLIRRLPYSTAAPLGAIIINIDENKISTLLKEQYDSDVLMYIVNQDGNIISHPNKEKLYQQVNLPEDVENVFKNDANYYMNKENNTIYAFTTSRLMGWKYICELSAADPLKQAENTKRLTLIVIIIYIAFGVAFSFFMAKKFYTPIKNLITSISKEPMDLTSSMLIKTKAKSNEYAFLEKTYSYLMGVNSNLEDSLKKTLPVLADKFFSDLLMGKKVVEASLIKELFDKYNMDIDLEKFFVMVVKVDANNLNQNIQEEFLLFKQSLIQVGREIIKTNFKGYVSEIDKDLIAMIVNVNFEDDVSTALDIITEELKQTISNSENMNISIGVGNFYRNLNDISFSYSEAIKAINNKFYYGKDIIIRYKEMDSFDKHITYDHIVNEQKFINFIKTKDIKGIKNLINEITGEIVTNRIDEQFVKQLFSKLIVSIIDTFSDQYINIRGIFSDVNNIFDTINNANTLDEIKVIAIESFNKIINCIGDKNNNRHIEEIINYIHKNYNKDICLNSVSQNVSLSPQYISKVFREYTGKNFTEYLAMYRLNIAKEIIVKENIPFSEVIKKIGFNNLQTFTRTFKKYEGITPGQFKQKCYEG